MYNTSRTSTLGLPLGVCGWEQRLHHDRRSRSEGRLHPAHLTWRPWRFSAVSSTTYASAPVIIVIVLTASDGFLPPAFSLMMHTPPPHRFLALLRIHITSILWCIHTPALCMPVLKLSSCLAVHKTSLLRGRICKTQVMCSGTVSLLSRWATNFWSNEL